MKGCIGLPTPRHIVLPDISTFNPFTMPELTGCAACAHGLLGWQARVPWVPSVWRAGSAEFWGAGDPGERGQRPFIFTAAVIIIQPQGELGGGPKGPPKGLPGETRSSGTDGHGEVTHTATAGSKNGCKDAKTFSRCEQSLAPNANHVCCTALDHLRAMP